MTVVHHQQLGTRVVYRGSALCRCPCDHMTSRHSESLVFASQSLAVDWSGVVWPAAGGICCVRRGVCVRWLSTCVRRAVVFSTGANMPARTKGESFATPHSLSLSTSPRDVLTTSDPPQQCRGLDRLSV